MNELERQKRFEPMAVLVLSENMGRMPESCAECPLEYNNLCCILEENGYLRKGDKCPLRSLPEKKLGIYDYDRGWNHCLDEILKERIA